MTERTRILTPRFAPIPPPEFEAIVDTPVAVSHLLTILGWRRDSQSPGEQALIDTYLAPLGMEEDGYGNLFLTLPGADGEEPNVAFTAHTDTVHCDIPDQMVDVTQALSLHHDGLVVGVTHNQCLGADDGTGVWILLNMIQAGVPGLYCFFRDEESGRNGSEWSARHEPLRYAGIDIMISFDRAGTTDIITHQMSERCCSEVFAERLADALTPDGYLQADPTGSFTDSYSFLDLIPECTNVSVGYNAQHSKAETQDLTWVTYLVNQLIAVDFAALPVARDPSVADEASCTMPDLIESFPDEIADLLETFYGMTARDLVRHLADEYAVRPGDIEDRVAFDQQLRRQDSLDLYPTDYEDDRDDPYTFT